MASLISIRIDPKLLQSVKENANRLHISQTEYIRQSIQNMNKDIEKKERDKKIRNASIRVRNESLKINAEFSEFERDSEF